MKPYPLASLNHFTVPVSMVLLCFLFLGCCAECSQDSCRQVTLVSGETAECIGPQKSNAALFYVISWGNSYRFVLSGSNPVKLKDLPRIWRGAAGPSKRLSIPASGLAIAETPTPFSSSQSAGTIACDRRLPRRASRCACC